MGQSFFHPPFLIGNTQSCNFELFSYILYPLDTITVYRYIIVEGGDCPKTFLTCEYLTDLRRQGGELFVKAVQKLSHLQKFLDSLGGGGYTFVRLVEETVLETNNCVLTGSFPV